MLHFYGSKEVPPVHIFTCSAQERPRKALAFFDLGKQNNIVWCCNLVFFWVFWGGRFFFFFFLFFFFFFHQNIIKVSPVLPDKVCYLQNIEEYIALAE